MATQMKLNNDFKMIQDEASKVIEDLSHLGRVLAEVGGEQSRAVKENFGEAIQEEIASLKSRIRALNGQIVERSKAADKHVHANPYPYMLGSLGMGLLLGKMLSREHAE